jgi:hypothetical protein
LPQIDAHPSDSFPHEAYFLPDAYKVRSRQKALSPLLLFSLSRIDHCARRRFPSQGRNDYIKETLVQLIVNYNSFITSEILPCESRSTESLSYRLSLLTGRQQENPNIAWEKVIFDKTLVDLEPEQGVPRYVTVER